MTTKMMDYADPNKPQQTLKLNGIAPRAFLVEYFAAVAAAGGANADTAATFLPWDLPEDRKKRLVQGKDPPDTS